MTGVEILAMEEVVANSIFNWSAFWIAFGILFCMFIGIGFSISAATYDYSNIVAGVIVGTVCGLIFGGISGGSNAIPTEYAMQYKVIISDEVLMNEFLEKYEIVDQEGKIYTVRERE